MGKQDIERLHKESFAQIKGKQFVKAIDTVISMLREASMYEKVQEAEQIRETYRYMVRYMLDGVADTGRDKLLSEMSEKLRLMSDMAYREVTGADSSSYYHDVWRFNRLRHESIATILEQYGIKASEQALAEAAGNDSALIQAELESLLERLFNSLLTSLGSDRDYADLSKYLLSGYADFSIVAQSLSAVTLSFCFFFDSKKFGLLLDAYENSSSAPIRARALAGIILAMVLQGDRIASDKSAIDRISLWQDSLETYTNLRDTIRAYIGTRDTERITNKLKEDVLPELMKLRPEIMKTFGDKTELDAAMLEDNPEWAELLNKSGLEKKMQELSELQNDGADLMMLTFSNLKQFPFFTKASNWFLPFNINNTALHLTDRNRKLVEMLNSLGSITCDSDMYSMALATNMMPEAQMDSMFGQLSANFEQLKEQSKLTEVESQPGSFDKEVIRVVRDLYRFFKLFRKREGFRNPFDKPLQFTSFPVVGQIMQDEDILRLMGEFYFKRGYYVEALPLFEAIVSDNPEDATLFEKIGFSLQSQGRLNEALTAYEKAALLKTPGPWLVNKTAFINRKLGNHSRAAELYAQALDMDPENFSIIMNLGNMLLETGDTNGALAQFYHANYLQPDNKRVIRALGWTELLNGNLEKSSALYMKLLADQPSPSDYLNAGHLDLLRGNTRDALNFYRLAAESGKEEFKFAYDADIATLIKLGVDKTTLDIMLDITLNEI